jgi:hypothetical protein
VGLAAKARSNRGLHPGPRCQQGARGGTLGKPDRKAEVRKRHAGFPDGRFDVLRVPICGGFRDGFSAQQGCLWVVGFHLPENQIARKWVTAQGKNGRKAVPCSLFWKRLAQFS